jgi:hypothetical protein
MLVRCGLIKVYSSALMVEYHKSVARINLYQAGNGAQPSTNEDFFELPTGCEREALRLTDLWYSTMRAGAKPHARSRSIQNAIISPPTPCKT